MKGFYAAVAFATLLSLSVPALAQDDAQGGEGELPPHTVLPPWKVDIEDPDDHGFTVIDANSDSKTWELRDDMSFMIEYNSQLAMDDWLVLPPLLLEKDKFYTFSFECYGRSPVFAERVEVCWGGEATPAGLCNVIIEPVDIRTNYLMPEKLSGVLTAPADGLYYIGVHAVSRADTYALGAAAFAVSGGISLHAPEAPSDIQVTADPSGTLDMHVALTAPVMNLDGTPLEDIEKIEVTRNGHPAAVFDRPAPGARLEFDDTADYDGKMTYSARAWNTFGPGPEALASARAGFGFPMPPAGVSLTRTGTEGRVLLQWEAVTGDTEGKTFGDGKVTYTVVTVPFEAVVAQGIEETSLAIDAVAGGAQAFCQYMVGATYGDYTGDGTVSPKIPAGAPYPGLDESGQPGSYIWATDPSGGSEWGLANASAGYTAWDDDGYYFMAQSMQPGQFGYIYSGLVSLEGMDGPVFDFHVYNRPDGDGNPDLNILGVEVRTADCYEWTECLSAPVSELAAQAEGWQPVRVDLEAYAGMTVQIQFKVTAATHVHTLVDGIRVWNGNEGALCRTVSSGKFSVRGAHGTLTVEADGGARVSVYAADGRKVYTGCPGGAVELRLPAGLYIVTDGAEAVKTAL